MLCLASEAELRTTAILIQIGLASPRKRRPHRFPYSFSTVTKVTVIIPNYNRETLVVPRSGICWTSRCHRTR